MLKKSTREICTCFPNTRITERRRGREEKMYKKELHQANLSQEVSLASLLQKEGRELEIKALRQCRTCKQRECKVKLPVTFLPSRRAVPGQNKSRNPRPASLLYLQLRSLLRHWDLWPKPSPSINATKCLTWGGASETSKYSFSLGSFHQEPSGIPREVQTRYRKDWAADAETIAFYYHILVVSTCGPWAISKGPRKITKKSKLTGSRLTYITVTLHYITV